MYGISLIYNNNILKPRIRILQSPAIANKKIIMQREENTLASQ